MAPEIPESVVVGIRVGGGGGVGGIVGVGSVGGGGVDGIDGVVDTGRLRL